MEADDLVWFSGTLKAFSAACLMAPESLMGKIDRLKSKSAV